MIHPTYMAVLRQLSIELKEIPVNWVVTGSLSFALQGLPFEPLYWLLSASVRERGLLGFHCSSLSGGQVELSHRNCREIVLVPKRKHGDMGNRSSRKASTGCMRDLQIASLDTTMLAGWCSSTSGRLHMCSCFRLPSGSHGEAHP